MSFGFSITDILACIDISYTIYRALKDAPRECQIFASEILQLYSVLKRLCDDINYITEDPAIVTSLSKRQSALDEHGAQCLLFLLADIADEEGVLLNEGKRTVGAWRESSVFNCSGLYDRLRYRFRQAKFVRKIPRLREAVAGIVSRLTAESVFIMRSGSNLLRVYK